MQRQRGCSVADVGEVALVDFFTGKDDNLYAIDLANDQWRGCQDRDRAPRGRHLAGRAALASLD